MTTTPSAPQRGWLRRRLRIGRAGLFWRVTALRRSLAKRPGRLLSVLVVLLAGLVAVASGIRGFRALREQENRRNALAAEVSRLEAEAATLGQTIERFRSDPAFEDLFARTRHQLVTPGEVVVLLRFAEAVGPPKAGPP